MGNKNRMIDVKIKTIYPRMVMNEGIHGYNEGTTLNKQKVNCRGLEFC